MSADSAGSRDVAAKGERRLLCVAARQAATARRRYTRAASARMRARGAAGGSEGATV